MDPLSISASIVTFIDIAKRIKASIDKISQNRKTLKELTGNVVDELLELQKLSSRRRGVLDESHLDYDLSLSLDNLRSELESVLERCQMVLQPQHRKRFSSIKSGFVAWLKSNEIEADITRLKDHVSSFHRRFTYITSMRMENSLLVVNTENRARMNRMEGLVARLLIDSHVSGIRPPVFLDQAPRDGIEYQYLRLQIQNIVDTLDRLSASRSFAQEEPHGRHSMPLEVISYVPHPGTKASMLRITMIKSLEILQSFDCDTCDLSIQSGAYDLLELATFLWDLGLKSDAAAIDTWAIDIYRTLMLHHPDTFMPYVAWGLFNLAAFRPGTREGLEAAKAAVSMYRAMTDTMEDHGYSADLPSAIRSYASELFLDGQCERAFELSKEALALQREVSDRASRTQETWIVWEASGEEVVVLSSSRSFSRTQNSAFEEGLCLHQLAVCSAALGRYTEALIAANDAVNCYQALASWCPGSYDSWLRQVTAGRPSWVAITASPKPCAFDAWVAKNDTLLEGEIGVVSDEESAENRQVEDVAPCMALMPASSLA